jgi:anti-anti-sigma factor
MDIQKTQNGDKITLALSGKLDAIAAPQLEEALTHEFDAAKEVVLDFAGITYVSSAGLRALLKGEKAARAKSGSQTLINVSDEVMNVFDMTGFTDVLKIQ